MPLDPALIAKLYRDANASRWRVSEAAFAETLGRAGEKMAAADRDERAFKALHLQDLALACACANGDSDAWDHFVLEYRPTLYRAADALDPHGGAREVADALYAELFGLREKDGERQSLFRYFHGRSSLATWLRAVLAQRFVDRHRVARRTETLPDDESPAAVGVEAVASDPARDRYVQLMAATLKRALDALEPRDRLRLACYYAQELTLAQIGKLLGEHEATVSRQLSRTRKRLREQVEDLLGQQGLSPAAIAQCFESVAADAGPLDMRQLLTTEDDRKEFVVNRSKVRGQG